MFLQAFCFGQTMLNVVDFGADPKGIVDALPYIQNAIDKAKPYEKTILYFPQGNYLIGSFTKTAYALENYCIRLHDNLEFKGAGEKTIIQLADGLFQGMDPNNNAHLFYGKNIKHVAFSNFSIDMNGVHNAPGEGVKKNHAAIFITHGQNVSLNRINIFNAAGTNMVNIKGNGSGLSIIQSVFSNQMKVQQANCHQYDFSFLYSEWEHTTIKSCTISFEKDTTSGCAKVRLYNGGIEIHGSNSSVANCSISGCFPGIYISSTGKPMKAVTIRDNEMLCCTKGISFWLEYPMDSILIINNTINIQSENLEHFRSCVGIEIPNGNAKVYNNVLANAAPISHLTISRNSITVAPNATNASGIILHSVHESNINNNRLQDVNRYGIALLGSKWQTKNCAILQNVINTSTKNYALDKNKFCPILISDTYSNSEAIAYSFHNIDINSNQLIFGNKNAAASIPEKACILLMEIPQKWRKNIKSMIRFNKNRIIKSNAAVCWEWLK